MAGYPLTPGHLQSFRENGYLIVKDFLKQQEVDLLREALETDRSLQDQQIQLNDQNDGKTKFALWYMQRALNVNRQAACNTFNSLQHSASDVSRRSNLGDGTLGMLTRSRIVHARFHGWMRMLYRMFHSTFLRMIRRVVETVEAMLGGPVLRAHAREHPPSHRHCYRYCHCPSHHFHHHHRQAWP